MADDARNARWPFQNKNFRNMAADPVKAKHRIWLIPDHPFLMEILKQVFFEITR